MCSALCTWPTHTRIVEYILVGVASTSYSLCPGVIAVIKVNVTGLVLLLHTSIGPKKLSYYGNSVQRGKIKAKNDFSNLFMIIKTES